MTEICASAPTTLIMAASRAVWSRSSPRATAMSRTLWFSCRITFADQNLAMSVCSCVRAVLSAAPYFLIWLNASTHVLLESDGGGSGRNCAPLPRMNGRTFATHGVWGAANGGVSLQTPGPGVRVGKDDVVPMGVILPSGFGPVVRS